MIENGIGVCRCLFNCSLEENPVKEKNSFQKFFCFSYLKICGSNGIIYRNLCEMERDRCIHENNIVPVDSSYCKLRMSIYLINKYFFCYRLFFF
jgi:hypothetical protein